MRLPLTLLCLQLVLTGIAPAREASPRGTTRGKPAPARTKPAQPEPEAGPQERLASGRSFETETFERLVFECVNAERRRHGLPPFSHDSALWQAARTHSGDMARREYFSHDTPRGFFRKGGFGDRLRGSGVVAARMAENIAMLPLVRSRSFTHRRDGQGRLSTDVREARLSYPALAAWAVQQWMESPGHRKNILSPALTTMGIGAAIGLRGREEYVYLTQDFGGH